MKTCKEYRMEAKTALKGNWAIAIAVTIVYGILFGICSATLLISIFLGGALTVGYAYTMFMLFRRGSIEFEDLFQGFRSPNFGSTIGLYIKEVLLILAWMLLFVVPGYIKAYSYAMAEFILADHPEITGIQAITASKNLMKGKKGKLFCLDLSFIGWVLLGSLTFGILFIWITPWMNASRAAFYESIKDEVVIPE